MIVHSTSALPCWQRPAAIMLRIAVVLALLPMWMQAGELKLRRTITSPSSSVTAIDLSSNGSALAVAGATGEVEVYSLMNSSLPAKRITGLGFERINAVRFSVQAERLIIGGSGDTYTAVLNTAAWDTEYLATGSRVINEVHDVGGVVFYLRDASMRQVIMLDMTSTRPHIEFIAGSISLLGHTTDHRHLVLVDHRQVMMLDAATMHVLSRTATSLGYNLTCIGLVGKGYTALIGTSTGDVLVVDVLDGRVVDTISRAHTGAVRAIEVTEEGIYTAGDDGRLRRWNGYEQQAEVEDILVSDHAVVAIGVTYRGDQVAAATADGSIYLYGRPPDWAGPPAPR